MLHRRSAIAAPVLGVLLAASMSACGFHYPTDRVNTISAGVNNRTASVEALGFRVLATAPGQGRLIGALSNERDTSAALTKVAGNGITVASFKPVQLQPQQGANLAADTTDPIELSGSFLPGQVLMGLQVTFTRGGQDETIELNVPVVKPCHQYTAVPTPSAAASEPGKAAAKAAKAGRSVTPIATSAPSESSEATESTEGGSQLFSCTDPSPSEAAAE
jgi:hypothetical protein